MNIGWGVDILRRAADECKVREIRRPKLYEAIDFLEQVVEPKWLVKRYRHELSGDRRNEPVRGFHLLAEFFFGGWKAEGAQKEFFSRPKSLARVVEEPHDCA
jgi:hypothetical protein